ncbi:hypothetical protein [Andreprevotia lacus]|jgi:hypothetical protein|uniref:hypothetical protein n=1 Tax=Andreprevotia lacus TaxID=1121000 RepID=UPI001592B9C9|nr:hypothetical protein [Andreprevotia lacus]
MTTPKKPLVPSKPWVVIGNDRALAPASTGTPMPKVKPSNPAPITIAKNEKKKG